MIRERIEHFLAESVRREKVAGAYLIYGGTSVVRRAIAEKFIEMIFCSNGAELCGQCRGCKALKQGSHPDMKRVIPEKKNLSIDEVREVECEAVIKPYFGGRKVFLFEFDSMRQEPSNAFLKLLEEPPDYAVLIFLATSVHGFIPTIISRCLRLKLDFQFEPSDEDGEYRLFLEEILKARKNRAWQSFFSHINNLVKRLKEEEAFESFYNFVAREARQSLLKQWCGEEIPGLLPESLQMKITLEGMEKILELKQQTRYNVNTKLLLERICFEAD